MDGVKYLDVGVLRKPYLQRKKHLGLLHTEHNASFGEIGVNRPFSLVDFVFPMQITWRYLGGLNLCRVH